MRKKAFSLSECIVTLSIIGILLVTMISLNKYNDYRMAQAKMAQVDNALHAWGKHIIQSNETGDGAITKITNQESLVASLTDYFNTSGEILAAKDFVGDDNENYRNVQQIKLSNGALLNIKYAATGKPFIIINGKKYEKNMYASNLIVIKVDVPMEHSNEVLSEQYGLRGNKLISMKELWN